MSDDAVERWTEVEPLPPVNGDLLQLLASVDTLRASWEEALSHVTPREFNEARQRSLRRHAIETGIIERLYDIDWSVTEALVAEGLTADVAAREGVDDDALAIIGSQHEALEFLAEAVRDDQDLTLHFVRQLHQLICREQSTYEAHDQFGRVMQLPLHHGTWKQHANRVTRQDGSLLEYTPPEHVQWQMARLLDLYAETADAHPVVQAAWLHHRFIRIHPFEDGNGRVGRALTLLVLLRARYAPLVVDRTTRSGYIDALDQANKGDLRALVRLFCRLEIVALRSELERPVEPTDAGAGAIDVARAYADRLRALRDADRTDRIEQAEKLAAVLHRRIRDHLKELGEGIREQFDTVDDRSRAAVIDATPPDETSTYWHVQLVRTAREADFFTNLTGGSWWSRLHLSVLGSTLRYVMAIQKVGHGDSGVLAVTAFAESLPPRDTGDDRSLPTPLSRSTPNDSVTLVFSDDPDARWGEIRDFVDSTLAAAVARFAQQLG